MPDSSFHFSCSTILCTWNKPTWRMSPFWSMLQPSLTRGFISCRVAFSTYLPNINMENIHFMRKVMKIQKKIDNFWQSGNNYFRASISQKTETRNQSNRACVSWMRDTNFSFEKTSPEHLPESSCGPCRCYCLACLSCQARRLGRHMCMSSSQNYLLTMFSHC